MAPREGLPGLDHSLAFSAAPLDHVFLVIHGAGDPYVHHPPWMLSLETGLSYLDKHYRQIAEKLSKARRQRPSEVMFLPVEWHATAFQTWQAEVNKGNVTEGGVRAALSETVGDVVMLASPFWRECIAKHCAQQVRAQLAAVKRNRPAFNGHVSLMAHSIGGVIAIELLERELIEAEIDAVVLTGCPIAAYCALAPDQQTALATIRRLKSSVRFINIFHPLDPVAFRIEPFVGSEGKIVKVEPTKRTFWDDASLFWDDVVYNLWSTLFPEGQGAAVERSGGMGDLFSIFGGNQRGKAKAEGGENKEPSRRKIESDEKLEDLRRRCSYVMNEVEGGSEILLSERIDFELQDGMGVPPLNVMASWGAIKAHTYYWQSVDVAQMLWDIVVTSETAKSEATTSETAALSTEVEPSDSAPSEVTTQSFVTSSDE